MSKANVSSSGSRILRVLKALRGHALNGVSNGELASDLGESPANINRALNTLIEEGLALKLDNGRFALESSFCKSPWRTVPKWRGHRIVSMKLTSVLWLAVAKELKWDEQNHNQLN